MTNNRPSSTEPANNPNHKPSQNLADDSFLSTPARIILGIFSLIFTIIMFLHADSVNYKNGSWIFTCFCLAITFACFTKGRISQFFGSWIALGVVGASFFYVIVRIIEIIEDAENILGMFEPIMFAVVFGMPSLSYLFSTQFGFAKENTDNSPTDNIDWYQVTFDEAYIYRDVTPPPYREWRKLFKKVTPKPWNDRIKWSDINQICFQALGLYDSDLILIHIHDETGYYSIPMEAMGGLELWTEILERKLFDEQLAVQAMGSINNEIFCTPTTLPNIKKM